MEDLAPTIHRQRLVIEGYPSQAISDDMIQNYLGELSRVIDMNE
jgi:hypothetical protein